MIKKNFNYVTIQKKTQHANTQKIFKNCQSTAKCNQSMIKWNNMKQLLVKKFFKISNINENICDLTL